MTWDPATSTVTLAAFASGQHRTVTFAYHGVAVGAHVFGAEVLSSTRLDPDSTPGNGIAAGEDDDIARITAFKAATSPATGWTPSTSASTTGVRTLAGTTTAPRTPTWVTRPAVKVKRRVPTVTLSASRAATVQLVVQRRSGGRWKAVQQRKVAASTRRASYRLRRLPKGAYRLIATVPGSAGMQTVRFTVA